MCVSVLTHTRPCPPPGAGAAFATVSALVAPVLAGAAAAAGLAEVFGLKKSARVFAGEGDGLRAGAVAVVFVFRPPLAAGEAETAAPAGDGEGSAVVFVLRPRLAAGEGEASVTAAGDAVASAFLCVRCFAGDAAGDSAGVGDCACRSEIAAKPMTETTRRDLMLMRRSLGNRDAARQDVCNEHCARSGWLRFTAFGCSSYVRNC